MLDEQEADESTRDRDELERMGVDFQLMCCISAEEAVLGSLIIDPEKIVDISLMLRPEDFYRDAHKTIFSAILRLYKRNVPADFVTLSELLSEKKKLASIGGSSYLTSLITRVPTSGNAKYYADILTFLSELRRVHAANAKIAQIVSSFDRQAREKAEQIIMDVGRQRLKSGYVSLVGYNPTYIELLEKRAKGEDGSCYPTGYKDIDTILGGGFKAGKLYVPCARMGVGKTTLCLNLAYRGMKRHGYRVGMLSLEMDKNDIMDKMWSMHGEFNLTKLENGVLEPEEWERLAEREDELTSLGFFFEYYSAPYLDEVGSIIRGMVQRDQVNVVIVDYLQLIKCRIGGKRITSREQEIAEIAQGLKALAGELGIAIVTPAQINREGNKTPLITEKGFQYRLAGLEHIRESDGIGAAADAVMIIARAEGMDNRGMTLVHIAKNRKGPVGLINLRFREDTGTFLSLANYYDEYGQLRNEDGALIDEDGNVFHAPSPLTVSEQAPDLFL